MFSKILDEALIFFKLLAKNDLFRPPRHFQGKKAPKCRKLHQISQNFPGGGGKPPDPLADSLGSLGRSFASLGRFSEF